MLSRGDIPLVSSSSGISSLLLKNGKTVHSLFNVPINIVSGTGCNIKKQSNKGQVVRRSKLLIVDELCMLNKNVLELVDKCMQDMKDCHDCPFGNTVTLLGGDPKQLLPVVKRGRQPDIVSATIMTSYLWQ